jgi:hypothetical protein
VRCLMLTTFLCRSSNVALSDKSGRDYISLTCSMYLIKRRCARFLFDGRSVEIFLDSWWSWWIWHWDCRSTGTGSCWRYRLCIRVAPRLALALCHLQPTAQKFKESSLALFSCFSVSWLAFSRKSMVI